MAYSNTTADRRTNPPGMEKNNFSRYSGAESSTGPNNTTTDASQSLPGDKNVNFGQAQKEKDEDRKRFFTGKYDKFTIGMISRRISVEDWVMDKMLHLYECTDHGGYDTEIDLDEILDEDEDNKRRSLLREKLSDAKQSKEEVNVIHEKISLMKAKPKFIEDLLLLLKSL